jgi:hypothetical protein
MVSVVFKWIGSMMQFGPSSSERMTSLWPIRFSHLAGCEWWGCGVGGGGGGSIADSGD